MFFSISSFKMIIEVERERECVRERERESMCVREGDREWELERLKEKER